MHGCRRRLRADVASRHWLRYSAEELHNETACRLSLKLLQENISFVSLTSLISRCTGAKDPHQARFLHSFIKTSKFSGDTVLGGLIVEMLGSCGCLQEAKEAIFSIPQPSTRSWTTYIRACMKHGAAFDALDAFTEMLSRGLELIVSTFVWVFEACSYLKILDLGRLIHAIVAELGCEVDLMVGTAVIKMYGKCLHLCEARSVFESMLQSDVVTWSSIISIYAHNNCGLEAWELYKRMQHACIMPDQVAYLCALDVCASLKCAAQGQQLHVSVLETGCEGADTVGTSLVNMYGKFAKFNEAKSAFEKIYKRNLVTWNTMLTVCVLGGHSKEALLALIRMQLEGFLPDQGTYVSSLNACSTLASIKDGFRIHSLLRSMGSDRDCVLGTALSKMYGQCGRLGDAIKIFGTLKKRDVVAWCGIMTVCAENGHDKDVLLFFLQSLLAGIDPDEAVFVCVLDVLGKLVDLDKGREVHVAMVEASLEHHTRAGTALINMYGKSGSIFDAKKVFQCIYNRNLVTWSAMIAAYAHSGFAKEAISLFQEMLGHDIVPNDVTFRSILTACSHTGQVNDGIQCFVNLCQERGLLESIEHRMSIIDLLGRAGHLDDAETLIEGVSAKNKSLAWACLLGACKLHGDAERAARIASHLYRLDPQNIASLTQWKMLFSYVADAGAQALCRYLKGTKSKCICYGNGKLELQGFRDSDMAGDVDSCKSTSGYVYSLVGGAVCLGAQDFKE